MKKMFFAIVAIALIAMGSMLNAANSESTNTTYPEMVQSGYSVTVMKIERRSSGGWIKAKTTGNYNSDENTITVHGSTYRVQDNPFYGESDDAGRGSYSKVAGGKFYFNL